MNAKSFSPSFSGGLNFRMPVYEHFVYTRTGSRAMPTPTIDWVRSSPSSSGRRVRRLRGGRSGGDACSTYTEDVARAPESVDVSAKQLADWIQDQQVGSVRVQSVQLRMDDDAEGNDALFLDLTLTDP